MPTLRHLYYVLRGCGWTPGEAEQMVERLRRLRERGGTTVRERVKRARAR